MSKHELGLGVIHGIEVEEHVAELDLALRAHFKPQWVIPDCFQHYYFLDGFSGEGVKSCDICHVGQKSEVDLGRVARIVGATFAISNGNVIGNERVGAIWPVETGVQNIRGHDAHFVE